MDKDLLVIEIVFLCSLLVNVFINNHLSIKLLLSVLLFFYILKSKPNYIYNQKKFLFISYGLLTLSVLFLLLGYFSSFTYVVFMFSALVLFLYLKYVLFRYSYGTIIKKNKQKIYLNIEDAFYRKKKVVLTTRRKANIGDVVIFSLDNVFLQKKQKKVISIIKK